MLSIAAGATTSHVQTWSETARHLPTSSPLGPDPERQLCAGERRPWQSEARVFFLHVS